MTDLHCGHCGRRVRKLERDATGSLACFACFVPDITQPKYRQPMESYRVPPPKKRVRAIVP